MRFILLCVTAIALSGCSWFNSGYHWDSESTYPRNNLRGTISENNCCRSYSIWNVEGSIGQEFIVGGKFTTPDDGVVAAPGLVLGDIKMKAAYGPSIRYELGGSRALNPNRKFTILGSYSEASGKEVALGTLLGPPANVLRGKASDYKSYDIEVGLRQYFLPRRALWIKSFRPYVEGKLGVAKINDIKLQNTRDNGGSVNGGTINMYRGSWVPTATGTVGVEAPIFKRATLGLETGFKYRGALKPDTTHLIAGGGVGLLEGVNNGSESFTMPVMLRGRYRF